MKIFQYKKGDREIRFVSVLGIYWTLGVLFLSTGLGMISENIWILIFEYSTKIISEYQTNNWSEFYGFVCILIGIGLIILALRTVKNDFIRTVYNSLFKTIYALGTMTNHRLKEAPDNKLQELEETTQRYYEETLKIVEENRLRLKEDDYLNLKNILHDVVIEIRHFHAYRKKIHKWESDEAYRDEYCPETDQKETVEQVQEIMDMYNNIVLKMRKKLRFTLEMPKIESISNT